MASNTVIQTNVLALNANRNLGKVGGTQEKSSQKLSSGYKINSAADDAAGLAISEKMRAQIRGLDMASKNTQDGMSLIQTAEGGLQEIDDMIQRIREIVDQAANDTNDFTTSDRQKLQDEIDQLTEGIDKMASTVEFNAKKLLDGSLLDQASKASLLGEINTKLTAALGFDAAITSTHNGNKISDGDTNGSLGKLYADNSADLTGASGVAYASPAATKTLTTGTSTIDSASGVSGASAGTGTVAYSAGDTFAISQITSAVPPTDVYASVTATAQSIVADATQNVYSFTASVNYEDTDAGTTVDLITVLTDTASDGANVSGEDAWYSDLAGFSETCATSFNSDFTGSTENVTVGGTSTAFSYDIITSNDSATSALTSLSTVAATTETLTLAGIQESNYTSVAALDSYLADVNTYITNAKSVGASVTDLTKAQEMAETASTLFAGNALTEAMKASYTSLNAVSGSGLWFQTGANSQQGINVSIGSIKTDILGIGNGYGGSTINVNLESGTEISNYIDIVDNALQYVTSQRAKLGAVQNRLEFTKNSVEVSSENLSAAESRIRDTDMAKEMMRYTKSNVIQQAAISMLAQANQQPQSVLQLLQ